MKTLILASSGTGKTMAAEICKNVVDLDIIEYAFIYDKSLYGDLSMEDLKNLINDWLAHPENYVKGSIAWNPECPKNYIDAIAGELERGNMVLVPFIKEVYELVQQVFTDKDIKKFLVFPEKDNFGEYEERYRKRGNDDNFIEVRRKEFNALCKLFDKAEGFEKIVLPKKGFLAKELFKRGICKEEKEKI